jgi:hypothetical protein
VSAKDRHPRIALSPETTPRPWQSAGTVRILLRGHGHDYNPGAH